MFENVHGVILRIIEHGFKLSVVAEPALYGSTGNLSWCLRKRTLMLSAAARASIDRGMPVNGFGVPFSQL
jgi:hypothetical protein